MHKLSSTIPIELGYSVKVEHEQEHLHTPWGQHMKSCVTSCCYLKLFLLRTSKIVKRVSQYTLLELLKSMVKISRWESMFGVSLWAILYFDFDQSKNML